ncbi:Integrase [Gammaproteobacteria bacterium]
MLVKMLVSDLPAPKFTSMSKPSNLLTLLAIKSIVSQAKKDGHQIKRPDGGGLYFIAEPARSSWWRFDYRYAGKQKTLSLGLFPDVSLAMAREQRDVRRKKISDGIDPGEERRAKREEDRAQVENAFEHVAREWHQKQSGRWSAYHSKRVIKRLEREVFPSIGQVSIGKLSTPTILGILRAIEDRGALDIAGRVKQHIEAVFRYSNATGRTESYNPVADLKGVLQTRKVQHRAALTEADLPEFLAKLHQYNGDIQTRHAVRLLMLTAVRTGEMRGARWEEINLDKSEWRIPAERMKMKAEHWVPLSRQVVEVIKELHNLNGAYELVLPGRDTRKPISENTILYALYRMGYHSRATGHGFRATFSTIMNERGYRADVIERQLAHIEKNAVRAAYHRTEYLADRRLLMQDWADYLDGLSPVGSPSPGSGVSS